MPNITNIPGNRVPWLEGDDRPVSREWYRFLLNLFYLTGNGRSDLTVDDLAHAPVSNDTSTTIDAMGKAPSSSAQDALIPQMSSDVRMLLLAPPIVPVQSSPRQLVFLADADTQPIAAVDTAQEVDFALFAIGITRGFELAVAPSRIYALKSGTFNFGYGIQLQKSTAGPAIVNIWFRIDGVDVDYSSTRIQVPGDDVEAVVSRNFVFPLDAGSYIEMVWCSDELDVSIVTYASAAPAPASPGVTFVITEVNP